MGCDLGRSRSRPSKRPFFHSEDGLAKVDGARSWKKRVGERGGSESLESPHLSRRVDPFFLLFLFLLFFASRPIEGRRLKSRVLAGRAWVMKVGAAITVQRGSSWCTLHHKAKQWKCCRLLQKRKGPAPSLVAAQPRPPTVPGAVARGNKTYTPDSLFVSHLIERAVRLAVGGSVGLSLVALKLILLVVRPWF